MQQYSKSRITTGSQEIFEGGSNTYNQILELIHAYYIAQATGEAKPDGTLQVKPSALRQDHEKEVDNKLVARSAPV